MSLKFYFNFGLLRVTLTFKFLSEFEIPKIIYMVENRHLYSGQKKSIFFGSFLLCFHNILDLIFKLKLGYSAIRCNLFIYINRMWIEKKIKINLHAQHTIRLRLDSIFTRGLIAINGLASLHFKMYLHPVVQ